MKIRQLITLLILLAFSFCSCHEKINVSFDKIEKLHPSDPFSNTIVKSQYFSFDTDKDHVIEGKKGTRIVLPKGCFVNKKGKRIDGKVTLELAEAFTTEDIILSNLTTTSNGKPLISDGMIYFNATLNENQLAINPKIPIYIEIPTDKRDPNMMVYKGIRDEEGNMNWINPHPIKKHLTPVNLSLLNFYPEEFEAAIEANMPILGYKKATPHLKDSLYYSFAFEKLKSEFDDKNNGNNKSEHDSEKEHNQIEDYFPAAVIDPAIIKLIRSKPYENTIIATREFESRLKHLHRACYAEALKVYVKNTDKNLWELDSMAADIFEKAPPLEDLYLYEGKGDLLGCLTYRRPKIINTFRAFSSQKLTNTKDADKYAKLLNEHFEYRLKEINQELISAHQKWKEEIRLKEEIIKNNPVRKEYAELLKKRDGYRKEAYGFVRTEMGWINIDKGIGEKDWNYQPLNVFVENSKIYDRVHVYILFESIKSLHGLNTNNFETFYVGTTKDRRIEMPKNRIGTVISIAYKNEKIFFCELNFQTGENELTTKLNPISKNELNEALKKYDNYSNENNIYQDLEYQALLSEQTKQNKQQIHEKEFWEGLSQIIFKCCMIGD